MNDDNPRCNRCGKPRSKHGIDPYSGEPVKCPVYRQEAPRPPSGDY